ncbi:MAG TPA: class I SAM-dependent methyltransferase [Gemmatimonadaceae bacterium]|nr:class I SAM-dependent methyltransferase [Gemmatimonadaceae bacterium]
MTAVAYELARCAVCASAESDEIVSIDDAKLEIELLWEYHQKRLDPTTPAEHLMDRVAFSQRPPLRLVRCHDCGLVYRNPVERPSELTAIYEEDRPAENVLRTLHDTQRPAYDAQAARLTEIFGRRGTGIEIGSYVGAFLAAARDAGWQFAGVDVNAETNAFTRSLGFQVHDGTIESLDPARRADVVAIWNCLDQLHDPASAVRAARTHLAAGGMLAIRVPNGACYAAFRPLLKSPLAAIAREWLVQNNLLGFPYRFGFTPTAVTRLVERNGMRVEHVFGDVLVPIADRWTKRWAALEERLVKRVIGAGARISSGDRPLAPWFELYARVE